MWLLVAFVAASIATGQSQSLVEVDVTESKAFQSSVSDTTISDCYITLPSGDTYELLPNDTLITSVDERFTVSSSTTVCRISIDSTSFSDSGSYSLVITGADNVTYTETFTLRVQARTPAWPSTVIDLIASESVYTFLNSSLGTVQACYVTSPGSDEVEVTYGADVSTNVKQWSPSTESWCGVEITNVTSSGYWKLTAAVNSTHFYYNRVLVKPADSSTADDTWTVITPVVGQSLTDYIGHENASHCQLTNPQGEVTQVVAGRCSFNITTVTSQHNGTWIAHTGLKGSPTEITETIDVTVQDIPYIYTGSSESNGVSGAIDIYCRVDGVESEICRFVSPDGTGLSMTLGVGNDDYAPYYDPEGVFSCGLTILDVSTEDYGTWTCYTGNSSDVRIGYITLVESETAVATRTSSASISVSDSYTAYSVYNSSLTLACNALTSLNYCWFGHPNGSYFTAQPDATDNELWSYSGNGLTSGSCSITFTHSTYDDAGTWSCNMGIAEQATDVSVSITVQITSSSLTARSVEEREGTASIECAVLDDTKALSYCRFIRPDGVGINAAYADSDSKYSMTGDLAQGTCGLSVSSVQDVDVGTWVCAGRLQSSTSELSDTFRLSSAPKLELSLLLIGVSIIKAVIS